MTLCVTGSAVWTIVSITVTIPSPSSSPPSPPAPPPGCPSSPSTASVSSPGSSGTTEYLGGSGARGRTPDCGSEATSLRHAESARSSGIVPRILSNNSASFLLFCCPNDEPPVQPSDVGRETRQPKGKGTITRGWEANHFMCPVVQSREEKQENKRRERGICKPRAAAPLIFVG